VPTIPIVPQADGPYMGYDQLVGAPTPRQAVLEDDGDTSYVRIPRLIATAGFISFHLFKGSEALLPQSISLTAVARNGGASGPGLHLGLRRGSGIYLGPVHDLTDDYSDTPTATWTTNPITGLPWALGDLDGLLAWLQAEDQVVGNIRVTQLLGQLTYRKNTDNMYAGRYREGRG
jgi:hypothetical protein